MKILNRYVFSELGKSFLTGMMVFSFILLLNNIFQFIDLLVTKNVNVFTVGKLFAYTLITLFSMTVPISMLFSVILTYGRLSEDNEILILRSAGMNTIKFTWQPVVMAILLTLVLFKLNFDVLPEVQGRFQSVYTEILKKKPVVKFEPQTFTTVGEYKVYVHGVDHTKNELVGINIYKPFNISIFAKHGTVVNVVNKGFRFNLYDGTMIYGTLADTEKTTYVKFGNYVTVIPLPDDQTDMATKTLREFTSSGLLKEIEIYKVKGLPVTFMETEYYLRWAISFAAVVFVIVGLPISFMIKKGSKSIGLGVCLLIIGVYYFLLITGITTAEKGRFAAKYALWLSDMILLCAGVYLNLKLFKK
jgi:lipopolysaccharide export system permease protein